MQQVHALEERIAHAEAWIKSFMKRSALCKKITAIDGVGPITATAIVAAVGKAKESMWPPSAAAAPSASAPMP
jgi:transposase